MARPPQFPELYDDDWLAQREPFGPKHVADELGCGISTAGLALQGHRRRRMVRKARVALAPSAEATRRDVEFRIDRDVARKVRPNADRLITRTIAALDAEQQDSPFPLRDALIDLAATCQAWAASLPTPSVRA